MGSEMCIRDSCAIAGHPLWVRKIGTIELMSISNNTLLEDGPTLIIDPTKPSDEMTGWPISIPSFIPVLINIVFAKVPPEIFKTLPVAKTLLSFGIKFNIYFNSNNSLSTSATFFSETINLLISIFNLIFSL